MNIIPILSVAALVFMTEPANAASRVMVDDKPGDGLITFTLADPVGDRFWDGTGAAIDVISAEFRITPQVSGQYYGTIDVFLTAALNEPFSRSVWLNMDLTNETASTRVNDGKPGYGSEWWTQSTEVLLPLDQQNQPTSTTLIYHSFGTTQVTNWLDGDTIAYYVEPNTYVNQHFLQVGTMFARTNGVLSNLDVIGVNDITAAVPEPESYAMLLAGLGLLCLTTRRQKQKLVA